MPQPFDIQTIGAHNKGVRIVAEAIDVIGDVHGCTQELLALLTKLGWTALETPTPKPPPGRLLIFVGDLVNRGPDSAGSLQLVYKLVANGHAISVLGNHDHVLLDWLNGPTGLTPAFLSETIDELVKADTSGAGLELGTMRPWLASFPWWAECTLTKARRDAQHAPQSQTVHIVHAAWHPLLREADYEVLEAACLFGPVARVDNRGPLHRLDWRLAYPTSAPLCLHGHTAFKGQVKERRNTVCLDTACVFGGRLSALRLPERKVVQVPAQRAWSPYPAMKKRPPLIKAQSLGEDIALPWPWNRGGPLQTFASP